MSGKEYAGAFDLRMSAQDRFIKKTTEKGVEFQYTYFNGEYSRDLRIYLEILIDMLLTGGDFVLMLELGGGIGTGCSDLAFRLKDQVKKSRIAFGVTNIVNSPEDFLISNIARIRADGMDPDAMLKDLLEKRKVIHYLTGTLPQIKGSSMVLPNGSNIKLSGAANVVHESYAVTAWSMTPETDIPEIGEICSNKATYLVPKEDTIFSQSELCYDNENEIREGIGIAHDILRDKMGFVTVMEPHVHRFKNDSGYIVFKRPGSS